MSIDAPRFVVVEPSLRHNGGHHYSVAAGAALAARNRGFEPLVLAHEEAADTVAREQVPIIPWFPSTAYQMGGEFGVAPERRFSALLDEARRRFGLGPADELLFPTAGVELLAGVLRAALAWPADERPFLHTSFLVPYKGLLAERDDAVVSQGKGPSLVDLLAAWRARADLWPARSAFYAYETQTPAVLFPDAPTAMQQLHLPVRSDLIPVHADRGAEPRHIVMLGTAREEKGYRHLPALLSGLGGTLGGRVRFSIHLCFPSQSHREAWAPFLQSLARFPAAHVRVLQGDLAPEAYLRLLAEADALLLPYDPQAFAGKTSGILVEALVAGKPLITLQGTWPARMAGVEAAIAAPGPESLGDAVRTMVQNYAAYCEAAQARAPALRARHSMEAFVDALLATSRRTGG